MLSQRHRLPVPECVGLGINLNLTLGHLHRHGLIHRDVKPANIIFVGGVPKLADIGLVADIAGGELLRRHGGAVNGVTFSPDGQSFLTHGLASHVGVWNFPRGDHAVPPLYLGSLSANRLET